MGEGFAVGDHLAQGPGANAVAPFELAADIDGDCLQQEKP